MADENRVIIDMRCSCGAQLSMEWPAAHAYSTWLLEIPKGWNQAHSAHHVEPKPEKESDDAT